MACARLGDVLANAMGNLTAGRAWFARASRLLEDAEPCVEQGWVAIAAMGCDAGDPEELLARAELALDRARRFGDVNLETKALADGGLAHVQAGRVAEGMALLDEAMALACGPADNLDACGEVGVLVLHRLLLRRRLRAGPSRGPACSAGGGWSADRDRWCCLSNHCDAVQATLLWSSAAGSDAEAVLTRAMAEFEAVMPGGELAPGDRAGRPAHPPGPAGRGRGAAGRQGPGLRGAAAGGPPPPRPGRPRPGPGRGPAGPVGPGRRPAAGGRAADRAGRRRAGRTAAPRRRRSACAELRRRAGDVDVPALAGPGGGGHAPGCMAAAGDEGGAPPHAGRAGRRPRPPPAAVAAGHAAARPGPAARAGRRRGGRPGRRPGGRRGPGPARRGAPPDDRALLERLGAVEPTVDPPDGRRRWPRDGRWWIGRHRRHHGPAARHQGPALPGRPGGGARCRAARARPGRRGGGRRIPAAPTAGRLGDAGQVLDGRARAAYRRRIEELRGECDEALAAGALERAEALQAELAQLVGPAGPGLRARRHGTAGPRRPPSGPASTSPAPCGRPLARLAEALPEAGAALDRRIRTGLYCALRSPPTTTRSAGSFSPD